MALLPEVFLLDKYPGKSPNWCSVEENQDIWDNLNI